VTLVTSIDVVSPEAVDQVAEVEMIVPPQMAALMGMTDGRCFSRTSVQLVREGP
jgi:hypothetical protein